MPNTGVSRITAPILYNDTTLQTFVSQFHDSRNRQHLVSGHSDCRNAGGPIVQMLYSLFTSFSWPVIFSDELPALFLPEFVGIPGDQSVQTVH